MKKQLCKILLLICAITLVSCSDDDANSNNSAIKLVKKITYSVYMGGNVPEYTNESVYHYENNILKSIVESSPGQANTFRSEFLYSGNKIAKVLFFENDETQAYAQTNFAYEGNLLKTTNYSLRHEKIEFFYQNGIISSKDVYVPYLNETEPEYLATHYEYAFSGLNVVSEKRQEAYGGQEYRFENRNIFDNKNNPMKHMNSYYRLTYNSDAFQAFSQNNYLSSNSYNFGNITGEYVFEIDYDSENYPTRISRYFKESHALVSQTDFEYQ